MSSIASPARREESWSGQRRSPPTTLVLFPQRTTRSQTSRVSELRNPGDTIPNDASNSKCSIPWFGGTYASFRYSVKLGRTLSMEQYQLDEPLRPGLDIILPSPKRRSRSRTLNPSIYSSPNAIDSDREMSLDYSYKEADADMSDHDTELDGVFPSPSRLLDFRTEHDSSSVLSWDVTPSLTFGFDEDEEESLRVEMLIDMEDVCEARDTLEWSAMVADASHQTPTPYNRTGPLELDVSLTMSQLSSLYPHVLEGSTLFIPNQEYQGKMFTVARRRKSINHSPNTAS
ncbi:hypothetical protein V565_067500 [Rhizoctonia solani 123E]|uniref:Uncharacterized protein n=1 Tax=Rhizoctonia solani 123E TaxID=1423351 RepID=A0A074S0L1_9AGAM|nr:hypothetical protein V565_067500 [Rhizoctonia solani 123E]